MPPVMSTTTGHVRRYGRTSAATATCTVNVRPRSEVAAAPALALRFEEERIVSLKRRDLIREAVAVNHPQIADQSVAKYEKHLEHFEDYLVSVFKVGLLTARRKHVVQFLTRLAKRGGKKPDASRRDCEWCSAAGFPDQRGGAAGWSDSTRKSYLSGIRFFYGHCLEEDDLPNVDPSAGIGSPKVALKPQYTPKVEEVHKMLKAPGRPRDRLLAFWTFYAPSRRATYSRARWDDLDLEAGTWAVIGKGKNPDVFALHPLLVRELKRYRRWQLEQAEKNSLMQAALEDPDRAYVLLTHNGKPMVGSSIYKTLRRRAVRAGVAVIDGKGKLDAGEGGKSSKLHPHAMRRGWATIALNDEKHPVPIDVVSEVLHHADISTTRRHYAHTKPQRAKDALVNLRV